MTSTEPSESSGLSSKRWKRLLTHLKPARWTFLCGVLAGAGYGVLSGAGLPLMLKYVVPVIFGQQIEPGNKDQEGQQVVAELAKRLFGNDYRDSLLLVACIAVPVIFLLRGACAYANRYLVNRAGFVFLDDLRQAVFARLQELPLAFFQKYKSGDLVSRLVSDAEQLKLLVVYLSNDAIKQPLVLVTAVGTLIYFSVTEHSAFITLIALTGVPACVVPIRLVSKRLVKRSRMVAQQNGELSALITESLQSPLEVQAYNLQRQQNERFSEKVKEVFRLSMKTVKYQSVVPPALEFISACGFMVALYFGVRAGIRLETFSAMGLALYLAYEPVKKLSALHGMVKSRLASLERLEQILDAEDTVPSPQSPKPLAVKTGEIIFDNVSFSYPTRSENGSVALSGVNVSLRPGETVALVGASGAGKTTFAMLIPRFFDPTAGRVTFCGMDLRELDKAELRNRIAIVPQTPVLFNISIAENIRLGRPGASDDEVRAAARKAFIADFIESQPQGYNTIAGERGAGLSGGQRQRVAIARAFLKDAPILILDEATSALDSESEAMVRKALQELMHGRTTVMIAHRFPSISLARRILMFEGGRITGDGPPETLGQSHATYKRMIELQRLDKV